MLDRTAAAAASAAANASSEIIALRARLEGMARAGAATGLISRTLDLAALQTGAAEPEGSWLEITPGGRWTIHASARDRSWLRAELAAPPSLPADAGGRTHSLVADGAAEREFAESFQARIARACAPIAGSDAHVCVEQPAPVFGLDTANRVLIYLLLAAAPALAVYGLWSALKASRRPAPPIVRQLGADTPVGRLLQEHEVPGVIGFWSWSADKGDFAIGHEAANLVGAPTAGAILLDDFAALISETDRARFYSEFTRSSSLDRFAFPFRGVGPYAQRHFELIGGPTEDGFAGVILDTTDRVAAQNRSRRAEALARTAIDAYPGPFAIWDTRRRLTHWNRSFQVSFGLDPAIVQPGASYEHLLAEASKSIKAERPLGEDSLAREVLLTTDRWLRVVDRKTSSDGYITAGLDITTLKTQEADLLRKERRLRATVVDLERVSGQAQELAQNYADAKVKAERASQAKSVFLANMGHELRTPLNHINGFSEMIANEIYGPVGDARYKAYAEDIHASGAHLLDLINDILDMAKIEAGKMQIVTRPIDPHEAVDAAVRLIRRQAEVKGLTLTAHCDEDLPEINGDHRAIKQMTLNLISNAIKFTDKGGHIRVETRMDGDWIVIRVKDSGIGIAADDLPRLGQPFEQAARPEGRMIQGTGLGLALTKSFAEMHGGHLRIESQVGKGTTVSIFLPVNLPGKLQGPLPAPSPRLRA